jgi:glycosyltransferase involved in cell wall biosynthesis
VIRGLKIALLGTRGVPAQYGGFETAVEEIGARLVQRGHDVTVYCGSDSDNGEQYRGMRRVKVPALRKKALETLSRTGLSTLHALSDRPDAALVFNAANAPYVAMLRAARIPVALHIDGHDARRAKWSGLGARYYRSATRWGSSIADAVIVDSHAVQAELATDYGVRADYIAYGAPEVQLDDRQVADIVGGHGLAPGRYHLVVARFEPENQVLEIVEGYAASSAQLPLVVVGFAGYPGDYARSVVEAARRDDRIRLLGAVWDQQLLDALYAGARSYVHGHSVGGTNPSLLRAMAQSTPTIAYDCAYNRETTGGAALWFHGSDDVSDQLKVAEAEAALAGRLGAAAGRRAHEHYRWSDVTDDYEDLARSLAGRRAGKSAAAAGSARSRQQDRYDAQSDPAAG